MTSTDRKARAAIYRAAADSCSIGGFSCLSLEEESKRAGIKVAPLRDAYKSVFAPRSRTAIWLHEGQTAIPIFEERVAFRVLALCFMAAMVEAGDA